MSGTTLSLPQQTGMNKQVFYDPQRKRWKRLRRILDVLALLGTVVFVIFIFGLLRVKPMKELLLPATPHNYRALSNRSAVLPKPFQKLRRSPHRKTDLKPSDVPLNAGEGLRADRERVCRAVRVIIALR